MSDDFVQRVVEILALDAAARVEPRGKAIVTGFWSTTGREIPLVVRSTATADLVTISDGGEAWWELVSEGYTDPAPTSTDREKLDRLCALHRVHWDAATCEITSIVKLSEAPDVARRVLAATLALDAWRAWYPTHRTARAVAATKIVGQLRRVATKHGWETQTRPRVVGNSGHLWPADALLVREGRNTGLAISQDGAEKLVERAIGWALDTKKPLVLVASPETTKRLEGSREVPSCVAFIARKSRGIAEQIMHCVEELQPLAA